MVDTHRSVLGTDDVTVVVATRDRRRRLGETLRSLRHLPERPPVIVVDNDSSDGTAEEAARVGVTVIKAPSNWGAAARTLGVEVAQTPYVAFCDDDSSWAPGSLARAAARFRATPRLGLLAARVLVEPDGREDPVCAAMAAGPPSPAGPRVLGFLACGAVVRRSAYLAVGGFHPRFGVGGEEDLLALDLSAAGWWCCYAPDVVACHAPARSQRDGAGRRRREVRNALWTAWLRRRPAGVVHRTLGVIVNGWRDKDTWAGVGSAVAGAPWVLAERRQVDPATEALRAFSDSLSC